MLIDIADALINQYPIISLFVCVALAIILLVALVFLILSLIAFFRGYKVTFWPPSFDPSPSIQKDKEKEGATIVKSLHESLQSLVVTEKQLIDVLSRTDEKVTELLSHMKLVTLRIDHIERQTVLPTYKIPDISSLRSIQDVKDCINGKVVLVKLDLDIPFRNRDGQPISHIKFSRAKQTIREIKNYGGKIVLLIGQGIAKINEFESLESNKQEYLMMQHAIALRHLFYGELIIKELDRIPLREELDLIKDNEIIILPNLARISPEDERCLKDQKIDLTDEEISSSNLVAMLHELYDIFVLDDFRSTIKRLPSNIGLANAHLSVIGEGIKRDIQGLNSLVTNCIHFGRTSIDKRLCICGSSRPSDILIIETILRYQLFDYVAVGPIQSLVFLLASGVKLRDKIYEKLVVLSRNNGFDLSLLTNEIASKALDNFRSKIILPVDYQVDFSGACKELPVDEFIKQNSFVEAIGTSTLKKYTELIEDSKLVFHFGMLGHTREPYRKMTEKVIERYACGSCISYMAGDHIAGLANIIGVEADIDYIIRGAKTTSFYFTNNKLPGLDPFVKQ